MHPKAIELCARKLASTGDLRKALDVCRYLKLTSQAIQLLETEHTKNPTTPTKVTIKHILTATKSMLTSPIQQRLLELGTHQKLILLALCFMKSLKLKSDLKNLEVCYRTLCMVDKCVVNLGSSDFMDVVGMLEVQAFLHRGKKGVDLNVNPDDVLKALERCKVLEEVVRDQGKVLIK
jgi:cell division control protein 6